MRIIFVLYNYFKLKTTLLVEACISECHKISSEIRQNVFVQLQHKKSSGHLLKDVLVIYVLEDCDEAGQLVLHLVLCHSLCGLLQQIVTVFCQLHRDTGRDMTWSGHCV